MCRGSILAVVLVSGCAEGGVRGHIGPDSPEIGLKRGGSWSSLTVKPPEIIGPRANLRLRHSVLAGLLDGRPVHVQIERGGAVGYSPAGQVSLDFHTTPDVLEVEGLWNGARVHLTFGPDSLRGTVAGFPARLAQKADDPESSLGGDATCQYMLGEASHDGGLVGTSICDGMPEPTRLEVPRMIAAWMTRGELAVVLVAMLSAPPNLTDAVLPRGY